MATSRPPTTVHHTRTHTRLNSSLAISFHGLAPVVYLASAHIHARCGGALSDTTSKMMLYSIAGRSWLRRFIVGAGRCWVGVCLRVGLTLSARLSSGREGDLLLVALNPRIADPRPAGMSVRRTWEAARGGPLSPRGSPRAFPAARESCAADRYPIRLPTPGIAALLASSRARTSVVRQAEVAPEPHAPTKVARRPRLPFVCVNDRCKRPIVTPKSVRLRWLAGSTI
jgi:hypothetical protein